ncbi:MAG: hypothetical protein ACYDCQ_11380 [Dehalococcoidia bacterium]
MDLRARSWWRLAPALGLLLAGAWFGASAVSPVLGQLPPTATPILLPTAAPLPTSVPQATVVPGIRVTYPPSWNLIGGPDGTELSGVNALYTFQAGDTSYETLNGSTALVGGNGYWVHIDGLVSVQLPGPNPPTFSRSLPAGQYVLIGNPLDSLALVSGADTVYIYDPAAGYESATVLQPGQGAWAYSAAGGTLTFTNVAP